MSVKIIKQEQRNQIVIEAGTGDIEFYGFKLDGKNYVLMNNGKSGEIGRLGDSGKTTDITIGEAIEISDAVLVFSDERSIDVLIEHLEQSRINIKDLPPSNNKSEVEE